MRIECIANVAAMLLYNIRNIFKGCFKMMYDAFEYKSKEG